MWSDKLKIKKQLAEVMEEEGLSFPKEIQEKSMTRIAGGQDIVGIGPEGSGKTTTYVLSVITRLKFPFEEAPRALILVPNRERVEAVVAQFQLLGKNTGIRTVGVFAGVGMEPHMDALANGLDVLVGTPDRVRELYLKLGLNVNKIQMFVLDDAELLIKQGFQLQIIELSRSLPKCQHLVFAEFVHDKLNALITRFLNFPHYIEISPVPEFQIEAYEQVLYNVPNFKTKLNLLNLLMLDSEKYDKVVVIVNTKNTAEKVKARLKQAFEDKVVILKPQNLYDEECESIEEFKGTSKWRILIIPMEVEPSADLTGIPYVIYMEFPGDIQIYIDNVTKKTEDTLNPVFISFSTDLELGTVKKIEQATGVKIEVAALPSGLRIEVDSQKSSLDPEREKPQEKIEAKSTVGAAFHEKKESNAKQYNYGYKDRQKMAGKVSKRRKS